MCCMCWMDAPAAAISMPIPAAKFMTETCIGIGETARLRGTGRHGGSCIPQRAGSRMSRSKPSAT